MTRAESAALWLAAFALALVTLHPAYQLDDSPWTVAACLGLGTQPAPGYPLVTLLGRLAALLPAGGPYLRVNLLAAALGATGALAAARLAAALVALRPGARAAGWFAGAALATTGVWWECALSAKGAVYLLNALLLAAATHALLAAPARRLPRAALLLGLACADHWMSAGWWIAVAAWLLRPWTARRALLAATLLALGASLYLQLPLCAAREPGWGDPVTLTGWLDVILRRTFLPQAALKPAGITPLQFAWELFAPWREGGVVVYVAAGLGALVLARRREAVALLAPVLLLLAAVAAVSNPVHVVTGDWLLWLADRFLLPWHLAAAVLGGAGLAAAAAALPPRRRPLLAAAVALALAAGGAGRVERNDHARDYLGFDYAENLRASLPPACAVLAEADYQCFPLAALRGVEERAPGMTFIITNPFLNRAWGWRRLARRLPAAAEAAGATAAPLTGHPDAAAADRLVALAAALRRTAPVLHLPLCSYAPLRATLRWRGLLSTLEPGPPPGPPTEPEIARAYARFRLRGLFGRRPWKDDAAFSVLDIYGQARAAAGGAAFRAGRFAEAEAACRRGLAFPGRTGAALLWASAGHAAARQNRFADAEISFRRALTLRPRDLDLLTNVATACAAQGRADDAMRYFTLVLDRDPANAAARANLALLQRQLQRVGY